MERKIKEQVTGYKTTDGAGVSLVRVLSNRTVETYDPILMLDSLTAGIPRTIQQDSLCIPIEG